jgi:hypothetical protein
VHYIQSSDDYKYRKQIAMWHGHSACPLSVALFSQAAIWYVKTLFKSLSVSTQIYSAGYKNTLHSAILNFFIANAASSTLSLSYSILSSLQICLQYTLISFNQHNKSTAQYHSNAKKLSHCEKVQYRPQSRIWFSCKFNTKSYYPIANNIQAEMKTIK